MAHKNVPSSRRQSKKAQICDAYIDKLRQRVELSVGVELIQVRSGARNDAAVMDVLLGHSKPMGAFFCAPADLRTVYSRLSATMLPGSAGCAGAFRKPSYPVCHRS